jgi:diketogulonate reductase-like aldo/keto reductase
MVIPKSADSARLRENAAAGRLKLGAEDLAELARALPVPKKKPPLAML